MKAKLKKYQGGGAKKAAKMVMTAGEKAAKEYLGAGSAGIKAGMKAGMKAGVKKGFTRGVLTGGAGAATLLAGTYGASKYGMKLDDARRKAEAAKAKASTPVKKATPKPAPKPAPKPVAKSDSTSAKRGPAQMKRGGMMKLRRK